MSELRPSLLALDKGLDLQVAKIVAPPGSTLDSLNYEQVDFQGQKRIDGYSRYDGTVLSAIDDFILVDSPSIISYPPYALAFNGSDLYGIVVGNVSGLTAVAVIDHNSLPDEHTWGRIFVSDPATHYDYVLQFNEYLRERVEELPGAIVGLHWFRDRLYAVVDIADYDPVDSRIDTANNASFFESRSVQQVLEEDSGPYDFGWRFCHQGWAVPFQDGFSPFGKLTSLNQNRQGVGVEGPTSIAGDNGRPQVLLQKVNITNLPPQVAGWKTSTFPAVYSVEAEAVRESGDDYYIYADAYFSWDGETGTVTAPGIDGYNLTEYSPSNSVPVETT